MKKTVLALLFLGSGAALLAQDTQSDTSRKSTDSAYNSSKNTDSTINKINTEAGINSGNNMNDTSSVNTMHQAADNSKNNMSSTGNYNAYSATTAVPNTVQMAFQKEYPGASSARWEQSSDWYRVHYQNNGQDMNTYYDARGNSFMMALPVTQSSVSTDVISKIKSMYGTNVYDVTTIKVADHSDAYYVRIIENGQVRSEVIDAQGQAVTQIYRTPEADSIWAAKERMKAMNADSMSHNSNGINRNSDQGTSTDSTRTNRNANNMNTNSSNSANGTLSTDANTNASSNPGNNNSNTNNTQANDQNATKTEEPKIKSDSTIKKDE